MANKNFDNCVSFFIDNGAYQGRFIRLNEVLDTIINKHSYPLPVSAVIAETTVLAAMRHIVYSDFSKIYSFEIPEKDAEILSLVAEKYVSVQSEYKFKTLDFYKSVKET